MNKKHHKHSNAQTRTPNKSTQAAAAPDAKEPVFSADALTKLSQKIQTGFDQASNHKTDKFNKRGKKDRKSTKDGDKKEETKATAKSAKPAKPAKPNDTPVKALKTSRLESRPPKPTKDNTSPEKKRSKEVDSNSKHAKQPSSRAPPKPKPLTNGSARSAILPTKPGSKSRVDKEALLKEIIELGGTQEDLDLVNGIDSESEEETVVQETAKVGKDVRKDIESFMKDIGLDPGKVDAATIDDSEATMEDEEWEDEDEDEEDDESEEDEDTEDEDEDEDEDVEMDDAEPIAAETTAPINASKGSKLVSMLAIERKLC
jgi:ribosome biogenesis protein MAK21